MQKAIYDGQEVQFETAQTYKTKHGTARLLRVVFPDGTVREMMLAEFQKKRLAIAPAVGETWRPQSNVVKTLVSTRQISARRVEATVKTVLTSQMWGGSAHESLETEVWDKTAVLPYTIPQKQPRGSQA